MGKCKQKEVWQAGAGFKKKKKKAVSSTAHNTPEYRMQFDVKETKEI